MIRRVRTARLSKQQPNSALQCGGHTLGDGLARLLSDIEHRGHRVGHRRRVGHCGQLEKLDAVRKFIGQPPCDLRGQPGLANAAHPGQGDQPMCPQRRLDLGHL